MVRQRRTRATGRTTRTSRGVSPIDSASKKTFEWFKELGLAAGFEPFNSWRKLTEPRKNEFVTYLAEKLTGSREIPADVKEGYEKDIRESAESARKMRIEVDDYRRKADDAETARSDLEYDLTRKHEAASRGYEQRYDNTMKWMRVTIRTLMDSVDEKLRLAESANQKADGLEANLTEVREAKYAQDRAIANTLNVLGEYIRANFQGVYGETLPGGPQRPENLEGITIAFDQIACAIGARGQRNEADYLRTIGQQRVALAEKEAELQTRNDTASRQDALQFRLWQIRDNSAHKKLYDILTQRVASNFNEAATREVVDDMVVALTASGGVVEEKPVLKLASRLFDKYGVGSTVLIKNRIVNAINSAVDTGKGSYGHLRTVAGI